MRPSVVRRPAYYFTFYLSSDMEFNITWQEARSQRRLPSLCFSGQSEKQMAYLASDRLGHFGLLTWNRWMEPRS